MEQRLRKSHRLPSGHAGAAGSGVLCRGPRRRLPHQPLLQQQPLQLTCRLQGEYRKQPTAAFHHAPAAGAGGRLTTLLVNRQLPQQVAVV